MNKPQFALFKNEKKQGNQPDYRSSMKQVLVITEPGEYRVAGWMKKKDGGQAYLSCILEKVEEGQQYGAGVREQNIAQIQRVRQELEGQGEPPGASPTRYPPAQAAPPPRQDAARYGANFRPPPQAPRPDADELPF